MKALLTEDFHPVLESIFKEHKIDCTLLPDIDTEGVYEIISDYNILIVNSKILVDAKMLEKASNLKVVGRIGSGLEIIDINYAAKKNIQVFNSPEGNCDAVAEHAIGMLLTLFHNISKANQELKKGIWQREINRGTELKGKTIGIIGYGYTGNAFAKKLAGFDVEILAYDKYKKDFQIELVREVSLEDIFQKADIVSLHLPLTAETTHYANTAFFEQFEKNIYLINTSRGKVCNTNALLKCIQNKKVLGAVLDVFENEKLDSYNVEEKDVWNQLVALDNIILTPHIAGWTYESKLKLAKILAQKVIGALT